MLEERSYAFVKSLMFGFRGWDRYILVEDEAARLVIQYLIDRHCLPCYYSYFIIEVGGAGQVISLLRRNQAHEFLAPADAVIAVLDGDQAGTGHATEPETYCMPLWSLESAFEAVYDQPGFTPRLLEHVHAALPVAGRHKAIYKAYRRYRLLTDAAIVELACESQAVNLQAFAVQILSPFLSAHPGVADVEPAVVVQP